MQYHHINAVVVGYDHHSDCLHDHGDSNQVDDLNHDVVVVDCCDDPNHYHAIDSL